MIKEVNLKIAFKKLNPTTTTMGKVICKYTNSKYYHVELIIDDLWVSSDTPDGVSTYDLEELDHVVWDYYDFGTISILEKDYITIMTFIENQRGKKYDYIGILFSQVLPFTLHSKSKLFCSEFITKLLQLFLISEVLDLQPNVVSPATLAKIFKME